MQFKDILKYLREEKNLSQKALAEACAISPTCICQLETGQRNPTGSTLLSLANFFDCSIDFLMGRNEEFSEKIYTPAPALPTVELELLADFRKLPDELRHRASKYMKRLVELYEEESSPKMDALSQKKNTGQFPA